MSRLQQVILLLMCYCVAAYAAPRDYFFVLPQCLLSNKYQFQTLSRYQDLRLIKTAQLDAFQQARIKQPPDCRGFLDVTTAWQQFNRTRDKNVTHFLQQYLAEPRPSDFMRRYRIKYQKETRQLLETIKPDKIRAALLELTELPDRHASTWSGQYAASWIKKNLLDYTHQNPIQTAAVFTVATISQTKQPSVILRIGQEGVGPAVVLGAHFDTLKSTGDYQPAANGSASGAVTLLETARILLSSERSFKKPIYLVWYAGSEEGRIGSQSIVNYFNREKIEVDAVLALDQTGYRQKMENGIGLADDFTDAALTAYVADLTAVYVKVPVGAIHCGYACSDHAIWYQNGNRVAYPVSTMRDEGNPYLYTAKDRFGNVSLDSVSDFVKLSVAFAVELAELS